MVEQLEQLVSKLLEEIHPLEQLSQMEEQLEGTITGMEVLLQDILVGLVVEFVEMMEQEDLKLKEIQDNYTRAVRSNYEETTQNVRPRIDKNRIDKNRKDKSGVADIEAQKIKLLRGNDDEKI